MALVERTAEDIAVTLRDLEQIAANYRNLRANMVTEGMGTIGLQDQTALAYVQYLKEWTEGLEGAFRRQKARKTTAIKMATEVRVAKEKRKSSG